ncbi:MAG: stage V sporulation protein AD [Bacilli bacterium]
MTFKYKNVYINETATITGPYEKLGPLGNLFDKSYKELYFKEKNFEMAETKLIIDSVETLLKKINIRKEEIDIILSGDLLNQIVASSYANKILKIPMFGIYSACATSVEGLIIGANMIESKQTKNCICTVSSHNNAAERQFRYPIEYGGPKRKTATFTTTGGVAAFLTSNKKGIKIESATVGIVEDANIYDAYHMGAVMSKAFCETLYTHLSETNREVNYYDLILSGDLGKYGKSISIEYMKKKYNINLNNYNDAGTIIYDLEKQPVYAGGSGPACLPLVTYTKIFNDMKQEKIKKVLIIATGALLSTTVVNEKNSIPSIAHAISLEVFS